jgi:hypothetical protein
MAHPTTIRSWPAILLAAFFAACTARVLLDDVVAGAPFTTQHLASIAALVASVAAGHYVWPALRQGAIGAGLVLAIVAVGASAYTVISSGMRNAETAAAKVAGATAAREDRAAARREWQRLQADLDRVAQARSTESVRAAMDTIVGSGDGKVPVQIFRRSRECTELTRADSVEACAPLSKLRVEMGDALTKQNLAPQVAAARARYEGMSATAGATSDYTYVARVIAALPYMTAQPDELAERLALLMPFAGVIIGELGIIAFAWIGLGTGTVPARRRKARARSHRNGAGSTVELEAANDPDGSTGSTGSGSTDPDAVHAWVREFRRSHGRNPQIPELQARFHSVPKTTAWRRINAA